MILLIEDRAERQVVALRNTGINLESFSDILDNRTGERYDSFLDDFQKNSFELDRYDVIACHKSAFDDKNTEVLNRLERFCEERDIPLVLFSGGIDANFYSSGAPETLVLNSGTFYSTNLGLFLESYKVGNHNLLILLYGAKWKLNILLSILEKINLLIENSDGQSIGIKRFLQETHYDNLIEIYPNIFRSVAEKKVDIQAMKNTQEELQNFAIKMIEDE